MKSMKKPAVCRVRVRMLPLVLSICLIVSGCTSSGPRKIDDTDTLVDAYLRDGPPATQGGLAALRGDVRDARERGADVGTEPPSPVILQGTDEMLAPMRKLDSAVKESGDTVTLEFADAPLSEVVQALLGDMLQLTYTVEYMPQGAVSLRTGGPIARDNVLAIVESMLQSYGAALVEDANGIYHITQLANVQQYSPTLYRPEDLPQGFGLVVVPLRYIGAAEMAEVLQPVAPAESIVRIDPLRNLIILAGNRAQHEGWMEIIRSFDVNYLKGMSLGVFPLEYASIDDVFESITALLGGNLSSDSGAAMPGLQRNNAAGGTPGMPGASSSSSGSSAPIGSAVRIFPLQRLNSLVAVSSRVEHLETVRGWIASLDQPSFNDLEPRLYVYPVQNGSASRLAELLSGLYSGSMGSSSGRRSDSGIAPGLNQTSLTNNNRRNSTTTSSTSTTSSSSGSGSNVSLPDTDSAVNEQLTQIELGEQVRVVADEQSNALLILAPRRDYRKIENALRQLDQAPTQILIEASIIEVKLEGQLKYGIEWAAAGKFGASSTTSGVGSLGANSDNNPAGSAGLVVRLLGNNGRVAAVLNMLAKNDLMRVLSNPSLLVQDNYTASIHVGDQQPVLTSTTQWTSSENAVQSSVEWKDTGVMLTVTPSTNAGGLVNMTIHQTVTDVGQPQEFANNQRAFMQREVKSRVSVRSGETIVMGGLIKETQTNGRSGVPGLHSIPFFGNLFGTTNEETVRTELLVLITPRIMVNEAELRSVSDEIRMRMRTNMKRSDIQKAFPPETTRKSITN